MVRPAMFGHQAETFGKRTSPMGPPDPGRQGALRAPAAPAEGEAKSASVQAGAQSFFIEASKASDEGAKST